MKVYIKYLANQVQSSMKDIQRIDLKWIKMGRTMMEKYG